MKWIVIYFFVQMGMIACPQPTPVPDEFGRLYPNDAFTLEACYETETTRLTKKFDTKPEAVAFIERAKKESDLTGFEIKEVKDD